MQIPGHNVSKTNSASWGLGPENLIPCSFLPRMCRQNGKPLYERPAEEAERRPSGQVKHMSEEFYYFMGITTTTTSLTIQDEPGLIFKKILFLLVIRKHIEVSALIDAKKYDTKTIKNLDYKNNTCLLHSQHNCGTYNAQDHSRTFSTQPLL